MFCRNCGKDIGDAKFCQYCGKQKDGDSAITIKLVQSDFIKTAIKRIDAIGTDKLIASLAAVSAIISIIIRFLNTEILTVYHVFAEDDYFTISKRGRTSILVVVIIQTLISFLLYRNAKKAEGSIAKRSIILFIISLLIQIMAMILKFPAPY